MGWITLISLGVLTLFQALIMFLGQFGFEFVQGGPGPGRLRYGWVVLFFKIVGLGISRRTGLIMIAVGMIDWLCGIIFFQMNGQYQPIRTLLLNSPIDIAYVLLAVAYTTVAQRWWFSPSSKR